MSMMTKKITYHPHTPPPSLTVTISKTADGSEDYMQIISADQFTLNIVLLSPSIEVNDSRIKMESSDDD